ncbi:hypothetical protein ACFLTO_05305 [Chloroflexota bacterium]
MNFLKNLALGLFGFLLFFSLSIFGLLFMLDNTLLKPEFLVSELERLDTSSVTAELINFQAPPQMPYLNEVINETIDELEPWMKEQLSTAIYSGYDYFLGKTENLSLTISTQIVKDTLRENLWEAFSASPPPELQGFPSAVKEQYFNEFFNLQFDEIIPPTIEFSESSLPLDALDIMRQVRQTLSYFSATYYGLIGFMVLLVIGIVLISRNIKNITRRLGIPLLTYGAIEYAGIWVAKYFAERPLPIPGLPPSLQTWTTQFSYNLIAPLEIFSLSLLIGGIVLVIVSFVYRRGQSSDEG